MKKKVRPLVQNGTLFPPQVALWNNLFEWSLSAGQPVHPVDKVRSTKTVYISREVDLDNNGYGVNTGVLIHPIFQCLLTNTDPFFPVHHIARSYFVLSECDPFGPIIENGSTSVN